MMLPYMSSRRRHEVMDVAFEMTGGVERLAHEMNRSTEGYWEGMKLWAKGLPRIANTEVSVSEGVESLLDKLDQAEREKTIDGAYEVLDAPKE
jgi:hypothetical protein